MKAVKNFFLNLRVLWVYKAWSPKVVSLPETQQKIAIDPKDRRARKKLIFDLVRKRKSRNREFWFDMVAHCKPVVCVDVGVNYGECLLGTVYPSDTLVIGVEANSNLVPYIERTISWHPNKKNIHLYNALAGDVVAEKVDFYVNRKWSGGSSGSADVVRLATNEIEHIETPSVRLDKIQEAQKQPAGLFLVKVDVEGWEFSVLKGMEGWLVDSRPLVVFAEFNTKFIGAARVDLSDYIDFLQHWFDVHVPTEKKSSCYKKVDDFGNWLSNCAESGDCHVDLLLLRNVEKEDLPTGWVL